MACQPVHARSAIDTIVTNSPESASGGAAPGAPGKLECVPYARTVSGIALYGDAYTWWSQAQGHYKRGHVPRVGAVMAIEPHGNSPLGHVATISQVVDSRTVLLDHANWSYPGKIETGVTALDVSPNNDWSEVRIWYGPSQTLGTTHWPVAGFIYREAGKEKAPAPRTAGTTPRNDPIGAIIADAL
ncbi:CHAP domain-containing protein [Novosphingobium profundi]|nr:CHAP domain-containing protein [Novosphingobium profundi]